MICSAGHTPQIKKLMDLTNFMLSTMIQPLQFSVEKVLNFYVLSRIKPNPRQGLFGTFGAFSIKAKD